MTDAFCMFVVRKSSLLQAFIGEMRKLEGDVVFGGPVAYASQAPWVQVGFLLVFIEPLYC